MGLVMMKFIAVYDEGIPCERDFHILETLEDVIAHKEMYTYGKENWSYYILGDKV